MLERILKKSAVGLFRGSRKMLTGAAWIVRNVVSDDDNSVSGFFDTRTDEEIAEEENKRSDVTLLLCVPALCLFVLSVVFWVLWGLVALVKRILGMKR